MALASIQDVQQYLELSKIVKPLPRGPFSLVYDAEADVVYIDFGLHPKSAEDSELTDDNVIIRYEDFMDIIVTFPEELLIAARETPETFSRLVMIYTLGHLYEQGKISSGIGASLLGL